ncbi:MAG: iron-containing alcohol dehydrogenase [Bacilli bacterium]|nr:iron-containing alcohol dehydrogenase [Bacilli bacterium]
MLGNFTYCNPTKLYFGEESLRFLPDELKKYGQNVAFVYGGGSIKRNGLYDQVMGVLKEMGKNVVEISGVMANPTIHKLREGVEIARSGKVDFILAAGGGSVLDYAKALAVSIHEEEDPWEKYFVRFEEPTCRIVPIGTILTMAGTGSEMNAGSVITYPEKKLKIGHVFASEEVMPRFSLLNPRLTMSLPKYQMVAGIYDIFNHICEQYFSGNDDCPSDDIAEALMLNLIRASYKAVADPNDYEARSNIMWDATWALNTLISKGKTTDWMVHSLGQSLGGVTDATHGMTLAAMSIPYYHFIMKDGFPKFVRFAKNVWHVESKTMSEEEVAKEGLRRMEAWMKDIGCVTSIKELGARMDMLDDLVNGSDIYDGGYRVLTREEIRQLFIEAMK